MKTGIPVETINGTCRDITYQVLVDMDRDGIYEVDISDWCLSLDYINSDLELQKNGETMGKPCINTAAITLRNSDGFFSINNPNNIESVYDGEFRRNTRIKILIGFIDPDGQERVIEKFRGVITDFSFKNDSSERTATLTLKDMAKFLQRLPCPDETLVGGIMYKSSLFNATISEAVSYLLDYSLGTDWPREIQTLTTVLPVIEFGDSSNKVWSVIQKLAEASCAKCWFEGGVFKFHSPLSPDWVEPNTSQYTFSGENIFDYTETVSEDDLVNIVKITSNAKTVQPQEIVVGTPDSDVATNIDFYKYSDSKNALQQDENGKWKVIILKSQADGGNWIDSIYTPLINGLTTYSSLFGGQDPETVTEQNISDMNNSTELKVWDLNTGFRLTVYSYFAGTYDIPARIVLKDEVNPSSYNIQISYPYHTNKIICGKYKDYSFDLNEPAIEITNPVITGYLGSKTNITVINGDAPGANLTDQVYYTNFKITNQNKTVSFRITNNMTPVTLRKFQALADGEFVHGTVGWSLTNMFISEGEVKSGTYALRFSSNEPISAKAETGFYKFMDGTGDWLENDDRSSWGYSVLHKLTSGTVKIEFYEKDGDVQRPPYVYSINASDVWQSHQESQVFMYNGHRNWVKVVITITDGIGEVCFDDIFWTDADNGSNVIANGGFETVISGEKNPELVTTGWIYSPNMGIKYDDYISGLSSLKFSSNTGITESTTTGYVSVTDDTYYSISGNIKNILTSGNATVTLIEYDENRVQLKNTTIFTSTLGASIWEEFKVNFVTQTGTRYVKVKINAVNAVGVFYADCFELRETAMISDAFIRSTVLIYGRPLKCTETLEVISEGDTSEYKNSYEITNDYFTNSNFCRYVTDYYRHFYEADRSFLDVAATGMPLIEIMDRVTVIDTSINVSLDYKVTGVKDNFKSNSGYRTTLTLQSLVPAWIYNENAITSNLTYTITGTRTLEPVLIIPPHGDFSVSYEEGVPSYSTTIHFNALSTYSGYNENSEASVVCQKFENETWGMKKYLGSINDKNATEYVVKGLLGNSTKYRIRIERFDTSGNSSVDDNSYWYELTTPSVATPPPPSGVIPTTGPGKVVRLDWSQKYDWMVSEYQIWRKAGDTPEDHSGAVQIGETTQQYYIDLSGDYGTTYTWFVRAVNGEELVSGFSLGVSAIVPNTDPNTTVPDSLAGITAEFGDDVLYQDAQNNWFVRVTINASGITADSNRAYIQAKYKTHSGSEYMLCDMKEVTSDSVSFTIDDLLPSVWYDFMLQPVSPFGKIGTGKIINKTTSKDTAAPAPPTGFAVATSSRGITIS